MQGGCIPSGGGVGHEPNYGSTFVEEESFILKHTGLGVFSTQMHQDSAMRAPTRAQSQSLACDIDGCSFSGQNQTPKLVTFVARRRNTKRVWRPKPNAKENKKRNGGDARLAAARGKRDLAKCHLRAWAMITR